MNDFIKLTKLYFTLNMKIYLYFLGVSVLLLSFMMITAINKEGSIELVVYDDFLLIVYGLIGVSLLGLLAFNNNKREVYFIINRNRIRQMVVILVYPVIVVGIISAIYLLLRNGDTFKLEDIATKTGIIAGGYYYSIILVVQLYSLKKDKNFASNIYTIIFLLFIFGLFGPVLDFIEELTRNSNIFVMMVGIIFTLVITLTPITYVVYLYRKLEV